MHEHYIEDKVDDLDEAGIEVVLRMNRHRTIAQIMNRLHSHIEKETERFKHELTKQLIDALESEL